MAPNPVREKNAPVLIRDEILKTNPDVIGLQECPSKSWGEQIFGEYGYISMGTQVAAHVQNGYIDLLVRKELAAQNATRIALEHVAFPLPSVAASITVSNGTNIVVCSNHLPHKAEGASMRELMCESIMQIVTQQSDNCICIGDFNMREKEDVVVESLVGGGWIDAWKKEYGSCKMKTNKFTWDSRENQFHDPSNPESYQFIARFDRAYIRGNELIPNSFNLIGNEPVDGKKGDYLSDHFGIVVKVGVCGSSSFAKRGGEKADGAKSSKESKSNDVDMVDLTGDSEEDDDVMNTSAKGGESNIRNEKRKPGSDIGEINVDKKSNDGLISRQADMRRLRLQRFMGMTTGNEKAAAAESKSSETASTTLSSSQMPDLHAIRTKRVGEAPSEPKCNLTQQCIDPVKPTTFAISNKPNRYVIYMAIRERNESKFARGLTKCNKACPEGLKHCLQIDRTRHVTIFDGFLTSNIVNGLSFTGDFDPIEIGLDGWKSWSAGCYLKLNEDSEDTLHDLLARIDGLPSTGGKRPCDHLSLYRKRPGTQHSDPRRGFAEIRDATKSHDWGNVEGVSVRVKAVGGPYEECMVLAGEGSLPRTQSNQDGSVSQPLAEQWNDGCTSDSDHQKPTKNKEASETIKGATFRNHSSGNLNIALNIVSWNISETPMAQVSAAAPNRTLRAQESANLIRKECLRPHFDSQKQGETKYLPDIIALQECPDPKWGSAVFGPEYVSIGTEETHCGFVDLLVRSDFRSERICTRNGGITWGESSERIGDPFAELDNHEHPSVSALITLPNKTRLAVASNHLAAHASGAKAREHQCSHLMELLTKKAENVILIGDFNMRQKEDKKIEKLVGGGWLDAWKQSGESKILKMTWNSNVNLYHEGGFGFTCRFDRAYTRGSGLTIKDFGLIGNKPVNGVEGDYLSDHYGLAVEAEAASSSIGSDRKIMAASKNEKTIDNDTKNQSASSDAELKHSQLKGKADSNSDINSSMNHNLHRCTKRDGNGGWSSDETPIRANGKRSRPPTKRKPAAAKSIAKANQPTNDEALSRGSKKEQQQRSNVNAKKKSRFESSSSDDDEEMRRVMMERIGKQFKPRRAKHLQASSSSDEDGW